MGSFRMGAAVACLVVATISALALIVGLVAHFSGSYDLDVLMADIGLDSDAERPYSSLTNFLSVLSTFICTTTLASEYLRR